MATKKKKTTSTRSAAKAPEKKTAPKKTAPKKTAPKKMAKAPPKTAPQTAPKKKKAAPRPKMPTLLEEPTASLQIPRAGRAAVSSSSKDHGRSGKYVYCIIGSKEPLSFGPIGIGVEPAEVHTINYGAIAAVVSDTPIEVYDPTRENVLAHERVNEAVMREHTVIPMSFGTVFKTREDIIELMRTASDAFRDVLGKMQNKLEFGLKVLWEPETIIKEIELQDENVRRLKREISSEKGSTYFARMQYGRLVDALLQEHTTRYVNEIFSSLRDVCVASRANKPIGEKMIVNGAFLVSRDKEADFDARVRQIGAKLDKLTFKYTGPWPPYNFVNIRLKLERAKEGEPA
jgi:hypothetical protein